MPDVIVIAGAGLAGAKAAETLRAEGHAGRIVLIGDEPVRPYERPPLSKDVLRGEAEDDSAFVHPADWYAEHGVELRTGTAVASLDPSRRRVALGDGEELAFDALLIATGAEPRALPVPGGEHALLLRTLADARALRERLDAGGRMAVIGAGWIGCEVAASARQRGLDVTLIAPEQVPLERVLGGEVGAAFAGLHRKHGIDLELGAGVDAIEPGAVVLSDGRRIEADTVVAGVGVRPRTELAAQAGLAVEDGILVDACLRTGAPGILAAGDVAGHDHPLLGRLRVEHWDNAIEQGAAAARVMLGADAPYDRLPYFFSDQYDAGMEYWGHGSASDEVVVRGDVASMSFTAHWVRDGRVAAAMHVNRWDDSEAVKTTVGLPVRDALGATQS